MSHFNVLYLMEITEIDNAHADNNVVRAPTEVEETGPIKPEQALSKGLFVGGILAFIILVGVAGFYVGKKADSKVSVTPTPSPTASVTPEPTLTETLTPTLTETTTLTATATPTPTITWVTKKAKINEFSGDFTLKYTLIVPSDVTVLEQKVGPWNGILLKKGTKSFMAFNLPYELYEIQGYSSITNVSSTTISNLKRVRSKKVFSNSGSYSFAVAYVTSTLSGTDCTAPGISDPTSSPCAAPALTYNSGIGFGAYCSVDPAYLSICDRIMKTITVTK